MPQFKVGDKVVYKHALGVWSVKEVWASPGAPPKYFYDIRREGVQPLTILDVLESQLEKIK